ncbi:TPA: hypothetical protein DIU27_01380 [Candidatus Collierbacteria bacterium]|uniref:Uncharacterized protein n=1 Tax=Candidatus Collierbacteria bacterium GW2011_GWB2_44_22 TaxID=1618387 RepID=A0A0G1HYW2_9BACT|nr:MAG: hypothetical protein UW31_C0015G0026 [Candidatus Collierbacteria bacterium GW2011_GWA2_44_13]KKT51087.1 MAG: hypothetical protein UW42_C0007G0010 [Candidatus Collierbacteria bacterium GW2011_GWB1_44_197]KKT52115.1 MAG: hypothetical protein UW44_C0004G0020 [Candidatus Collierbacteria bacterium GW2011_GWB2_44_22]KKT63106.1 MAG: hypothetical protein UW56_C0002G0091 [Candidatus Collierbacteria bacterium GW2011_GWD1_44_27]KKT66318.1 MAG: hypothetical protein UW58_C0010G0020 [Candidatus Colli
MSWKKIGIFLAQIFVISMVLGFLAVTVFPVIACSLAAVYGTCQGGNLIGFGVAQSVYTLIVLILFALPAWVKNHELNEDLKMLLEDEKPKTECDR